LFLHKHFTVFVNYFNFTNIIDFQVILDSEFTLVLFKVKFVVITLI